MSKQRENIDADLATWILRQHLFFVATAPFSAEAHINISPKGGDAFRVLGPMEVVYQDYTGSGAEAAAHLRENGRIVILFCGFEGNPRILRLHGQGALVTPGQARFAEFEALFPKNPGTRAFVQVAVQRVSTSCGYSVPLMEFRENREILNDWAREKGPDGLSAYRTQKNATSIDGMPAFGSIP